MADNEVKLNPETGGAIGEIHPKHRDKNGYPKSIKMMRAEMDESQTTLNIDTIVGVSSNKPRNVSRKQFEENWDRIFGNKKV